MVQIFNYQSKLQLPCYGKNNQSVLNKYIFYVQHESKQKSKGRSYEFYHQAVLFREIHIKCIETKTKNKSYMPSILTKNHKNA